MRKINKVLKWILAILLLINIVLLAYIRFAPVDVIANDSWTITVDKSSYTEGDVIAVTSEYQKFRQVTGVAKRYLNCLSVSGANVRYELEEAEANREAGKNATGINVRVPEIKEAPTKCHITIAIDYSIFGPLRHHPEQNDSNDFDVLLKSDAVPQEPVSVNQNTVTTNKTTKFAGNSTTPSQTTNNTTNNTTNTTNNNPAPQPVERQPERGIVTQVLDLLNPTR